MKRARKWDVVDFLKSDEGVVGYLDAAFEDGDPALATAALGDVARAKGMGALAEETGVTRDGPYTGLSATGDPSFTMVCNVLKASGLRLDVSIAV